jgi:hypothetical protein
VLVVSVVEEQERDFSLNTEKSFHESSEKNLSNSGIPQEFRKQLCAWWLALVAM